MDERALEFALLYEIECPRPWGEDSILSGKMLRRDLHEREKEE